MNEADWLAATDLRNMLNLACERVSARKLRLFACACCRRVWRTMTDRACRRAVEVSERFAEGLASPEELQAAFQAAQHAKSVFVDASWAGSWVAAADAEQAAFECAAHAASAIARAVAQPARSSAYAAIAAGAREESRTAAFEHFEAVVADARRIEETHQAGLLAEIVGNPFQPVATDSWPTAVTVLATALNAGEDCAYALHDALVEANRPDVAAHFQNPVHLRGCWAVDLILGRS
jgi:hypothetical protein